MNSSKDLVRTQVLSQGIAFSFADKDREKMPHGARLDVDRKNPYVAVSKSLPISARHLTPALRPTLQVREKRVPQDSCL